MKAHHHHHETRENDRLAEQLRGLEREQLLRWCDEQLQRAPAIELERLLVSSCYGDPRQVSGC